MPIDEENKPTPEDSADEKPSEPVLPQNADESGHLKRVLAPPPGIGAGTTGPMIHAMRLIGAGLVGTALVVAHTDKKQGPPTPRPTDITRKVTGKNPGGDSDDAGPNTDSGDPPPRVETSVCDVQTFAVGLQLEPSDGSPCRTEIDKDGIIHVIGHTLLDHAGVPRACFLTVPWVKNAALKFDGIITGDPAIPGKIHLQEGKICMTRLKEPTDPQPEIIIEGEAPIHIFTTGQAMVKIIKEDGKTFAMVTPQTGETVVMQEGRKEPLTFIKSGSTNDTFKIPLDIQHAQELGCLIASKNQEGDFENHDGETFLLTAGAVMMLLARKKKDKALPKAA